MSHVTLLNKPVNIVADLPSATGERCGIRAGESGRVVWDEPGGDVIVEFAREVPNERLLPNNHQAWVPRGLVAVIEM